MQSPPPKRLRRGLILILKLAATVAVFAWLFFRSEIGVGDLMAELRSIELSRFLPWLMLGVLVKLLGIFGNILRWQLLLRGQGLQLSYRFLAGSFFVGRFFGIVTPGTLGLDGFKLYDTIRITRQPVACTAVIAIDKVIGAVGLASLLAIVFPVGHRLLPGMNGQRAVGLAMIIALATATFFVILLKPRITQGLLGLIPDGSVRRFGARVVEASTAYADHRAALMQAVALAIFGHLTTALMYWTLLMGMSEPGGQGPQIALVLFCALAMTSATLVGPTVGGEGIREIVFIKLLAGVVAPVRSFLFAHAGFWIEKGLLGLPGGLIYLLRRATYDGAVTPQKLEELQERVAAESNQSPTGKQRSG